MARHDISKADREFTRAFETRGIDAADARIMLSHYSCELLYSPAARAGFAEPDVAPIPEH